MVSPDWRKGKRRRVAQRGKPEIVSLLRTDFNPWSGRRGGVEDSKKRSKERHICRFSYWAAVSAKKRSFMTP